MLVWVLVPVGLRDLQCRCEQVAWVEVAWVGLKAGQCDGDQYVDALLLEQQDAEVLVSMAPSGLWRSS